MSGWWSCWRRLGGEDFPGFDTFPRRDEASRHRRPCPLDRCSSGCKPSVGEIQMTNLTDVTYCVTDDSRASSQIPVFTGEITNQEKDGTVITISTVVQSEADREDLMRRLLDTSEGKEGFLYVESANPSESPSRYRLIGGHLHLGDEITRGGISMWPIRFTVGRVSARVEA